MVFNTTFNNISAISWRSVLLVEETWIPGENTDPSRVTDKLYNIMLYTLPWSRFELTTSVVYIILKNSCLLTQQKCSWCRKTLIYCPLIYCHKIFRNQFPRHVTCKYLVIMQNSHNTIHQENKRPNY